MTQNPMHSSRKIACKTAFADSLLACLSFAEGAAAEVTLVEKDGWTFFADGRVGAFLSVATGADFLNRRSRLRGPIPRCRARTLRTS